jgi:hypothetical protein
MKSVADILTERLLLISRTTQDVHDLALFSNDAELVSGANELSRQCARLLAVILDRAVVAQEGSKPS